MQINLSEDRNYPILKGVKQREELLYITSSSSCVYEKLNEKCTQKM